MQSIFKLKDGSTTKDVVSVELTTRELKLLKELIDTYELQYESVFGNSPLSIMENSPLVTIQTLKDKIYQATFKENE